MVDSGRTRYTTVAERFTAYDHQRRRRVSPRATGDPAFIPSSRQQVSHPAPSNHAEQAIPPFKLVSCCLAGPLSKIHPEVMRNIECITSRCEGTTAQALTFDPQYSPFAPATVGNQ